jgi:hypothetical protein
MTSSPSKGLSFENIREFFKIPQIPNESSINFLMKNYNIWELKFQNKITK